MATYTPAITFDVSPAAEFSATETTLTVLVIHLTMLCDPYAVDLVDIMGSL